MPATTGKAPAMPTSNHMPFTADQSSSALIDEEPYSGKQNVTNPFTQTTPQGLPNSSIRPSGGAGNMSYEGSQPHQYAGHHYLHNSSGGKNLPPEDTSYAYTL